MSLHLTGFPTGEAVALSNVTIGSGSGSISVPAFRSPTAVTTLPRILGGQFPTDTLSLMEDGLTGITSRQWRVKGGMTLGTGPTQPLAGLMGQVECEVVCDQGTLVTPSVGVYMSMGMASHNADDAALLALVPHTDATHIAVSNGAWKAESTWLDGRVPGHGARVLIPHGLSVIYNCNLRGIRLDWIRIDGTLKWRQTGNTYLLVETIVATRGAVLEIGTAEERISADTVHEITFSDRDYRTSGHVPADIDIERDARVVGRGLVWHGTSRIWAARKTAWLLTANANAPMAGETQLVLERAPTNWQVGDEIVIGGTAWTISSNESQSEKRRISEIDGAIVKFSEPLIYDHHHQHPSLSREDHADLQPAVINLTRNVRFLGENTNSPAWRRPHTMGMHHMSVTDWWGAELFGLGRTVKDPEVLSGINENGNFKIVDRTIPDVVQTGPVTARSNLQSRYSFHLHFVGFGKAFRDVMNDCSVHDNPGWAIVHHGCEAELNRNVMYDFGGAGMVGEISNETGPWVGNCAIKSRHKTVTSIKNVEGAGLFGDPFRHGYGFALRGRAPQVNGNFAMDVSYGFGYYGRSNVKTLQQLISHKPSELDIGDLQGVQSYNGIESRDYPIEHFNGNRAAGTAYGLNVVKIGAQQDSMYNIILKNFTSWGYNVTGGWIEYVNQYVLRNFRCLSGNYANTDGIHIGSNAHQISIVDARTELNRRGINFVGKNEDLPGKVNTVFSNNDPRYMIVGHESVSDTIDSEDTSADGGNVIRRWGDADRPPEVAASSNLPFILGQWNGSTNFSADPGFANTVGDVRGTYTVSDSVGPNTRPLPSVYNDYLSLPIPNTKAKDGSYAGFAQFHSGLVAKIQAEGYYNYNDGAPRKIVTHPLYIGDRIYGRPMKYIHAIEYTGAGFFSAGDFVRNAAAPVISDQTVTCEMNKSVTLTNLPALASSISSGTGTPVVIVAGQSNAGRIWTAGGLQSGITALVPNAVYYKVNAGGQSLAQSDGAWNIVTGDGTDAPGYLYTEFLDTVAQAKTEHPGCYIAGVVWVQGEADSYSNSLPYYEAGVELFTSMRADTGEEFPIVIVQQNSLQSPTHTAYIQAEQTRLASDFDWISMVSTDDIVARDSLSAAYVLDKAGSDTLHYSPEFSNDISVQIIQDPLLRQSLGLSSHYISPNFENADFGDLEIVGNDVVYTPFSGFRGIDEGYVFIADGQGHETRCQIVVQVGLTPAADIASGDWTLTQAPGNSMTFTLAAQAPDSGGARILRTEYSTDNGATWRRLCYQWVPGGHVVTRSSASAALTSGQSLANVQLRYKTDLPQTLGSDTKSITLD